MSMNLHEKSLELNVTHELLNLCDAFNWHLTNIGLWRYWEPSYRHFRTQTQKKSIALGLHSSVEGNDDNTGNAGGGYDVKIKSGSNDSVLFIQYKRGEYRTTEPEPNGANTSIFTGSESEHYLFKLNSTATNQHFTLRNLSNNITSYNGNAVVYAFPLIKDIDELEENAGRLLNRTKFISISDIDNEANTNGHPFVLGSSHKYRICPYDMDRTEFNFFFFTYKGRDISKDVIADFINLSVQKEIRTFAKFLSQESIDWEEPRILSNRINYALSSYLAYLRNYLELPIQDRFSNSELENDFVNKLSLKRNLEIYDIVNDYVLNIKNWVKEGGDDKLPEYTPSYFTNSEINIKEKSDSEYLDNLNMFVI